MVFRLVVFRPFTSEVIIAKVKSSDEDGVRRKFLTLYYVKSPNESSFFSHCWFLRRHIHSYCFLASTKRIVCLSRFSHHYCRSSLNTSDPNERCHFWISESTLTSSTELLDTPVTERMYIERDEIVRVRVESDEFYDDEPGPPKLTEGVQVKRESKRPPYTICVSTTTCVIC